MTTSFKHQPLLSLVVTTRNDSDQALQRMQIFVDGLLAQARQFQLSCELVVVEWNPPSDRPSIAEALDWISASEFCRVRIINVPPELHAKFDNSDVIPLFQMIAKNVGIRRAHGKFILATNVDILFSNELIQFFASGKLRADRMYRIDRSDVPANMPQHLSVPERLDWCKNNVFRLYRFKEIVDVQNGVIPPCLPKPSVLQRLRKWFWKHPHQIHTNACGDFTLLSSEYWQKTRGYPEFPLRAMKLDGLLCYSAYFSGAREIVLEEPMGIYHLDHPARSDGAGIALTSRGTDSKKIQLPMFQYRQWVEQMQHSRIPILFNGLDWGLWNENLIEAVID